MKLTKNKYVILAGAFASILLFTNSCTFYIARYWDSRGFTERNSQELADIEKRLASEYDTQCGAATTKIQLCGVLKAQLSEISTLKISKLKPVNPTTKPKIKPKVPPKPK